MCCVHGPKLGLALRGHVLRGLQGILQVSEHRCRAVLILTHCFRRSIKMNIKYECKWGDACTVELDNRKGCQACR